MSRFGDDYDGAEYNNAGELWAANARRALQGRKGQKALRELREALLALPEKRLIEGAVCTVGLEERIAAMPETVDWGHGPRPNWERQRMTELVASQQGEGVCAIGAYAWHKNVKAGMTPEEAFEQLPVAPEADCETADLGKAHGLTWVLAWELAYRNDELYDDATPEERYEKFLAWIDEQLDRESAAPVPELKSGTGR